ncbi:MAG: hypothetical protein U5R31_13970 [Acidimicrobiia bacterium]|nr:hypothetical protein [Acidimicrobiia bacterium]
MSEPRFTVRRLGLRSRITVAFGLGALLLSVLLAVIVYGLTRENLLNQRERSVTERALINATSVRNQLTPDVALDSVLASVATPEGTSPLLYYRDRWTQQSADFGETAPPAELQERVASGEAALMRTQVQGSPTLVVGVPIDVENERALYFEGAPLSDIEETLSSLAISLLGAAAVTTLAGAVLGFYASRRVLARSPRSARRPSSSPPAGSRRASRHEVIPTWDRSSGPSTRWSRPSRTASSATPASRPR